MVEWPKMARLSRGKAAGSRFFLPGLSAGVLLVLMVGGYLVFSLARADLRADIYRDRLRRVAGEYAQLVERYNAAVLQSAVTELVVQDGVLSVRVRSRLGVEKTIPTPYDPAREIYVDYAVVDGRLWIRRVFDDQTPPRDGVVIDPDLAEVDWEQPGARVGKAVYRALGEGVWQVSVTGQGALGLVRVDPDHRPPLVQAPRVLEFEAIEQSVKEEQERVGFFDLLGRAFGW
ncbi:MAG: hypothetical protein KatS3mg103_1111 [Phycisphaerales bacterium]|nr:MAG: hypothetical protein KatS3mg103_1111 [Phycisphaerales bacterium]